MTPLAERLHEQARDCAQLGSPLMELLLHSAADDVDTGGPTATLLEPHADDRRGSALPLRFAGALHRLVLERRAPSLALHYPSVGGTPGELWPVAREVVAGQLEALRPLLRRPVQTNEVGRAAALYGGLLHVTAATGLPVRLLEVGASAGLNLNVDRFAYDVADGVVLGDPASPVVLARPWSGALPPYDAAPRLVARRGCDPAPLDPASTADRLTLTSYVWADQVHRFARLRAALQVAVQHPEPVERLPASAFLERELAAPVDGVATVVWHSVVWQYLDRDERAGVTALLDGAGARATRDAPLLRLALEPSREDGGAFVLRQTTWPSGVSIVLADAEGHGPPVRWR